MIVRYVGTAVLVACGVAGCSDRPPDVPRSEPAPDAAPASRESRPVVLFLGTSLTAGYGLPTPDLAFPAIIQAKLDSAGYQLRVVNAGVSGESSAGALARIDWLMDQERVAVLVVETGANDGLRGQDPDSVKARIQAIFDRARQEDPPPKLVLAGMEALPNLGRDYVRRFREIYPELARTNDAALVPFLLTDVAGVDSLNQGDGIHPTAAGQRVVAENVWRVMKDLLP